MDESFANLVLDEEVDCVRFHSTDAATVVFKDGSQMAIKHKDNGWRISAGYSTDAATATGMYDRY